MDERVFAPGVSTEELLIAILEGYEQTLDHVLAQMDEGGLRPEVDALQAHIAGRRQELEAIDDTASNSSPGVPHVS